MSHISCRITNADFSVRLLCQTVVDYELASAEPRISGAAWIGQKGQARQEPWRFSLVVGQEGATPGQID